MNKTFHLKLWASASALLLGSTACTITTGSDEGTDDGDGTEETEAEQTDAEQTDAETEDTGDAGTGSESTDTEADEPEPESTDSAATDADEPAGEGTDAEPEPATDGDSGVAEPEPEVTDPPVEAEPEPTDRSDEYAATAPSWDCGDRDPGDAEPIELNMTEDGTWSGTVYIDGEFRLRDAELTIEPGTRVILGPNARIVFGYLGSASTVRANGTQEAPITFCGEAEDVGYWRDIVVGDTVAGVSNLSNVLIDGGGADGPSVVLEADLLVDNVVIQRGADVGLRAADFDPDSENLYVTGHEGQAVELTTVDGVMNFPRGGNLTGNDEDVVHLDFANANADATFRDLRVPYLFDGSELRVRDGATLVLEAGTEFSMGADARIIVGYLGGDATFQANGASGNPIVFRGEADDQGFWGGILLADSVRTDSILQHVDILGAGSNDVPALDVDATIAIADINVENSGRGVRISDSGVDEDSTAWTITGTDSEPLEIDVNAWPTLPTDVQLTGNEDDRVLVTGTNFTTDGIIPNLGVPYLISGEVRFRDGVETEIAAGTEFIMSADTRFDVGYLGADATLIAAGTEEAPIRFTGLDPVAGYWNAIIFESNANSSSMLSFVEVGHAGQGEAAVMLRRAVPVTNCTIFESENAGIAKEADDDTDYTESNTFTDNGGDDVVDF